MMCLFWYIMLMTSNVGYVPPFLFSFDAVFNNSPYEYNHDVIGLGQKVTFKPQLNKSGNQLNLFT